ncbi:zinc-dependent MarR family transcriptional regulator [Streptococcus cuniculipharyngis]|nr:zinc-dependent MarR family transcriptional regulator [Streptococcus cuniculipharyngis]
MLAKQIDALVKAVILKAENQQELLIGSCQSGFELTNTQEHILMLLAEEDLTNSDLAKRLRVSQPAITKAIKNLEDQDLLSRRKHPEDARRSQLVLTTKALPIAQEHAQHHLQTLQVYQAILQRFSSEEQAVLERFVQAFTQRLEVD